jgi:hypothetical protein
VLLQMPQNFNNSFTDFNSFDNSNFFAYPNFFTDPNFFADPNFFDDSDFFTDSFNGTNCLADSIRRTGCYCFAGSGNLANSNECSRFFRNSGSQISEVTFCRFFKHDRAACRFAFQKFRVYRSAGDHAHGRSRAYSLNCRPHERRDAGKLPSVALLARRCHSESRDGKAAFAKHRDIIFCLALFFRGYDLRNRQVRRGGNSKLVRGEMAGARAGRSCHGRP